MTKSQHDGKRPGRDEYFLSLLQLAARRSTCARRATAAIVVDEHGHVLSTGYNGVPRGFDHCTDHPCPGASEPSGTSGDDESRCQAVHAEINALLQAKDLRTATTMYTSTTPCRACALAILNTNIRRVVVTSRYTNTYGEHLLRLGHVEIDIITHGQEEK